jgi:hypothetical protein
VTTPAITKGRPGRTWLTAALLAALVLASATLVFRRAVYEAPSASSPASKVPPGDDAAVASEEAVVLAAVGNVQRATAGGDWSPVSAGDRLHADDAIRTAKGGSAGLRIGERSRLSVAEASQLSIRELTRAVHRLRLERGRIAVDYEPDGRRVLRIENEASGGVAETTSARFSVLSTGTTVAVATETGSVDLRAADKVVRVAAGSQAMVRRGEAPRAPEQIPVKLLLKVAGTALGPGPRDLCARVEGIAQPGAQVTIDGVSAEVDENGRFSVPVPREPKDKRKVLVAMRDVLGREESRTVPCERAHPESPIQDFAIRWRNKRPP